MHTSFHFLSANGRTELQGYAWTPEGTPKAVIQIAHGITEYMGRYEDFAAYFTQRGYAVVGHDQLGHGRSVEQENPLPGYFGPRGSWQLIVDDLRACTAWIRQQFPGAPVCQTGLSLGSFAVRCLMGDAPEEVDLAILAGTGHMTPVELAIAQLAVRVEEARCGDQRCTPLVDKLTMGLYNQKFTPRYSRADWLLANRDALDVYLSDPLVGQGFTVGSFRDLLDGMKICCSDQFVPRLKKSTPMLLLSGQDDPVGSFGKGVEKVCQQLKAGGCTDVTAKMFPGMRHDVFREKGWEDVLQLMDQWISQRI